MRQAARRYGVALTLAVAAWLAALLLVAMLLTATRATAAVGDLELQGCLSMPPAPPGCTVAPAGALSTPVRIAVSPDGTSVYVSSEVAEGLTHLTRAEDGTLGFGSCVTPPPQRIGCEAVDNLPTGRVRGLAVSPDGAAVYVASNESDAVSRFTRDPQTGRPTFSDCLTNGAAFACGWVETGPEGLGEPLRGAWGLAVSPEGGSVYIGATVWDTVSELTPTGPAGELEFAGCLGNNEFDGCGILIDEPFSVPGDVVVSPDGSSFHVVSAAGSIASLGRQVPIIGSQYLGCLGEPIAGGGCDPIPAGALRGAADVAISQDGTSIYTVTSHADVLARFSRAPDGRLAFEECFSSDELEGCVDLPGSPLLGAASVAVSADGASVYATAVEANALVHFERREDGALAYGGCASPEDVGGDCLDVPPAVMFQPVGVAVSPRGNSVYVTGSFSSTVVAFERVPAQVPGEPGGEGPGPEEPGEEEGPDGPDPDPEEPGEPDPGRPPLPEPRVPEPPREIPQASCAGEPATVLGTPGRDTLRGTAKRDVIAGLGGADTIRGRGGNDLLCGGTGRDTIFGGAGSDRCLGGPGRDEDDCEPNRRKK